MVFILPLGASERAVMVGRMEVFILPLGASERAVMVGRMEAFILPLTLDAGSVHSPTWC